MRPANLCSALLSLSLVLARGAAATGVSVTPGADDLATRVRAWRVAHEAEVLRELVDLLALPNVAEDEPNIEKNARAIAELLRRRGLEPELLRTAGAPPVVFAELRAPAAGARAVTFYAHYDGQPVDPAQWHSPPWQPVLRDGPLAAGGRVIEPPAPGARLPQEARIYARSAGDDKAAVVGLLAALDALRALGIAPTANLKLFFEGEEEAGSPHLAKLLAEHAARLETDGWILCDGPVYQNRQPLLVFGARGVTGVELTVYGANRGLHSGHYGNWAPNPIVVLANLLSSMRHDDGRILIDGFYDSVRPLGERERAAIAAAPQIEADLRRELGLAATEGGNARLLGRLQLPAMNLRGFVGGHVGDQATNSIPTEASASIDFRLVPDQTLEEVRRMVEAHLARQGFKIVRQAPEEATRLAYPCLVKVTWGAGYPAGHTPMDGPFATAVLGALERLHGRNLVVTPMLGGSIPIHVFQGAARTPVVIVPIANHDDNQHVADENLRLQNLWDGIETYAALFAGL